MKVLGIHFKRFGRCGVVVMIKISDVSMGGVCVQGNSDFDFTAGNRLLLFVMGQKSGNALSAELPVEIKGEVMWRDSGKRRFGLRFFL